MRLSFGENPCGPAQHPRRRFFEFGLQDFFQPTQRNKRAKRRMEGGDGTFRLQGFRSELIENHMLNVESANLKTMQEPSRIVLTPLASAAPC
jgi:hypothetical protein